MLFPNGLKRGRRSIRALQSDTDTVCDNDRCAVILDADVPCIAAHRLARRSEADS
jgi:hypothetical protein